MEISTTPYIIFLEKTISLARLKHSLGVMQVMSELAEIYGLDREKSILAGLLHDAGKELTPEQQEQIIKDAGISVQSKYDRDYVNILHGPVGAYFVYQQLGITDPLVLDAIAMHTYYGAGVNFDSPLVWCLRFSDILEPNRKWDEKAHWIRDGQPRLRSLVYSGRLDEAAFFQTGLLIRFFEEIGNLVHPNLRKVYRERSEQLDMDDTWFMLGE
jgi:predicted HD superfamily hydrolase involved in NAD metabolism